MRLTDEQLAKLHEGLPPASVLGLDAAEAIAALVEEVRAARHTIDLIEDEAMYGDTHEILRRARAYLAKVPK